MPSTMMESDAPPNLTGHNESASATPAAQRPGPYGQRSPHSQVSATPQSYAKSVMNSAGRSPKFFLHSGLHYKPLAEVLRYTADASLPMSPSAPQNAHLVVHEWALGSDKDRVDYSKAEEIGDIASSTSSAKKVGQLIFIRGYSSSEWLLPLCAQFRIDPEFLRRHLDFLLPKDYYHDLPALPSTFAEGFSLTFVTISNRPVALTRSKLHEFQRAEDDALKKCYRLLGVSGKLGESIVRRWTVHDEWTSTLEQNISIYVKSARRGDGWTAIAWLDCGRELAEGPNGPWLEQERTSYSVGMASQCKPIIQHLSKASWTFRNSKHQTINGSDDIGTAQNLRLLPFEYGSSIEPSLASADALYALNELFGLAAASESQFLNMMQVQIRKAVESTSVQMQDSLNGLKRMKTLIDDHLQYLQTTLEIFRYRALFDRPKAQDEVTEGDFRNPSPSEGSKCAPAARRAADQILSDFEHLLRLAKHLSRQCLEGTHLIMNTSMLEESRKSIKVSEYVAGLSFLAFLFLPLTFTTGFFGMKFREFGQGDLSIWVFCTILVPVMIFVGVLCFWNQIIQFRGRYFKSGHQK